MIEIVYRGLATLALLAVTIVPYAGEIKTAKVSHKNGVYFMELEAQIASDYEPVLALVMEYDQLHRISEVLIETRLISDPGDEIKRRKLVTRTCILVFCFTSRMVEDVFETENTITTVIVADQSDYRYGKTVWRVNPVGNEKTSIYLHAELEPDFWIPPFIGPYLLKRKMLSEARKTINRIEALSIDG